MEKNLHLNQKFTKFINNDNFEFDRSKILKILKSNLLDDAYKTISRWQKYKPTPLESLSKLSKELGLKNIFYKDESKRFGLKSFKALGGAYAVEKITKGKNDVIVSTATAGNHGKSVAWGARNLGLNCKIFISENVSETRAKEMRNFGAEVIRVEGNYENSLNVCKEESKKNNWEIIQDVAWPDYELVPKLTMAGYSTMIKEISVQTNEYITHIFLQAGVGGMAAGLIAGVANYFKKVPKIIIVEPENANCVMQSIENNTPTNVDIKKESIMGGMSCGDVSLVPWQILKNSVNSCVSVSDKFVSQTVAMLADKVLSDISIVGGECSTPGITSLISCCNNKETKSALDINENSNILLIGCEGSTDIKLYKKLLSEGKKLI
ncbi:MAG: diaminopropionate ammonia-lyase [Candidatus Pelagibacter sp.]|tara:strand:- start:3237 stop:4373 length:1137 start_codon:yes stop_codon:yes gene_type:complete